MVAELDALQGIGESTYGNIHEVFSETIYGWILSNKVRFDRFRPEDDVSEDEWKRWLGKDVDNLEHMPLTLGLTQWFLREHRINYSFTTTPFTPEEERLLCAAAIIHDEQEALTGDTPLPEKDGKWNEIEMTVLHKIVDEVHDEKVQAFLHRAIDEVLLGGNARLAEAFQVIEHIGYVRTECIAWEQHKVAPEPIADALRLIGAEALNERKLLEERKIYYPAAGKFLSLVAPILEDIQLEVGTV